jgi:gluconate 2-dehydrogenase gamma chain
LSKFDETRSIEGGDKVCMDKKDSGRLYFHRRELLIGAAYLMLGLSKAHATIIVDHLPWTPNAGNPPTAALPGSWVFFTRDEGRAMEAIADRIIPPDPQTPGGKESAIFIDRQLAGPYGRQDGLYVRPPFMKGTKSQGRQSEKGPAQEYREGLAALDRACKAKFDGKAFADLSDQDKDAVLNGLESAEFKLDGADGKAFFDMAIKDVQMGFFADPIYGGNRDMVAWKMIGYPGSRYNYLDWVNRHNERFPLPPVSMTGRAEWTPQTR